MSNTDKITTDDNTANKGYPELAQATDQQIMAALKDASIPTLMMSMIHMSGDNSLLDGPIKPNTAMLSEIQGYMSEEDKEKVRQQAFKVIREFRQHQCQLPPPPDHDTIVRMMAFITGEQEIPADYLQMMQEEMSLGGVDMRHPQIDRQSIEQWRSDTSRDFHVAIIGGGMSGLLAAARLHQAGIPYTLLEKNDDVGGTWYENKYPGCRVDIANHFYSYSFDHDHNWSKFFAERDELHGYFRKIAEKYHIVENTLFNSEVTASHFDEQNAVWVVDYCQNGQQKSLQADVMITAVGQLNRPRFPAVSGREKFKGLQMHTAEWQDFDPTGLKIAVIGTGASAFQLVPELAKADCELTVIQRSPPWMMDNPHYHSSISAGKQWCLDNLPFYQNWFRFLLFWPGSDGAYPMLQIDPEWDDDGRSINEINKMYRDILIANIESRVQDPELLKKVVPDYPPLGKRLLQDNGSWFKALQQDNVQLVDSAVSEVTTDGIITADGNSHQFDVLIWATGFHADTLLAPMQITGRGGAELGALWGDEPKAYLGITVPKFPNMFCLYGPNTNLAHAGSIIFHSECQVQYLQSCIKYMLENELNTIECTEAAFDRYEEKLSQTLAGIIWSYPKMDNWYKNSRGRVVNTSPWKLVDYWNWTREMAPRRFHRCQDR